MIILMRMSNLESSMESNNSTYEESTSSNAQNNFSSHLSNQHHQNNNQLSHHNSNANEPAERPEVLTDPETQAVVAQVKQEIKSYTTLRCMLIAKTQSAKVLAIPLGRAHQYRLWGDCNCLCMAVLQAVSKPLLKELAVIID